MIKTDLEYNYCLVRGYEPLIDSNLSMEHSYRVQKQKELFGKNDAYGNRRFYKWCLRRMPHICEECGKPIGEGWAGNVSHILSRGAHPEMAHDPRNVNILCLDCHARWENKDRENMHIWAKNERTIAKLKEEYR